MSVIALDDFESNFRLVTEHFQPVYGIEHSMFESDKLLLPESAKQIHIRDELVTYCVSSVRLLVIRPSEKPNLYRYDYFTSTDPRGLYMTEVVAICDYLLTAL